MVTLVIGIVVGFFLLGCFIVGLCRVICLWRRSHAIVVADGPDHRYHQQVVYVPSFNTGQQSNHPIQQTALLPQTQVHLVDSDSPCTVAIPIDQYGNYCDYNLNGEVAAVPATAVIHQPPQAFVITAGSSR